MPGLRWNQDGLSSEEEEGLVGGKGKRRQAMPFQRRDGKGKRGDASASSGTEIWAAGKRGYLAAPAFFIFPRPRPLEQRRRRQLQQPEPYLMLGSGAGAGEEPELQPGAGRRGEPTRVAKIPAGKRGGGSGSRPEEAAAAAGGVGKGKVG